MFITVPTTWNGFFFPMKTAISFFKPRRGVMNIVKNEEMMFNPEGVTEVNFEVNHTIQTDIFHHIPLRNSLENPGIPV